MEEEKKTVNDAYMDLSKEEKGAVKDIDILRSLYTARLIIAKHSKIHAERSMARRLVENMKKKDYKLFK